MKTASRILSTILIVILFAVVAMFAVPRIFGVHIYSVLSGSMEPSYHVGDLIYTVPQDMEDIEVGDTITFMINKDGMVATHRVVDIDEENQRFYTKGDANQSMDGSPVHYNNIVGTVEFRIPVAGYAAGFLSETPGKIIGVTIAAALLVLSVLMGRMAENARQDKETEDV